MSVAGKWSQLVAFVNGRDLRDPDFQCDGFTEGKPNGDCETDGHYRCMECVQCNADAYRTLKGGP